MSSYKNKPVFLEHNEKRCEHMFSYIEEDLIEKIDECNEAKKVMNNLESEARKSENKKEKKYIYF